MSSAEARIAMLDKALELTNARAERAEARAALMRERCAKVCEAEHDRIRYPNTDDDPVMAGRIDTAKATAKLLAAAIRALPDPSFPSRGMPENIGCRLPPKPPIPQIDQSPDHLTLTASPPSEKPT